jgi:hypothetical protein
MSSARNSSSLPFCFKHDWPHRLQRQMWILFAVLAGTTAVSLVIYNRWVTK